jgi:diadenylate cyclase
MTDWLLLFWNSLPQIPPSFFNGWLMAWEGWLKIALQFAMLAYMLYLLYTKYIRFTQAERLVKGMFFLLVCLVGGWAFTEYTHLQLLSIVLSTAIYALIFGLIVIFQPELRRVLLFLGQNEWFNMSPQASFVTASSVPTTHEETERVVMALTNAIWLMGRNKTGALLVLEPMDLDMQSLPYLEMGIQLDARITSELILTIFHANTPLHDGAVVIDIDKTIVAAGALLPLTEDPNLSWRYGTRHRAAIGVSELSPVTCFVVSEETGTISHVQHGKLTKLPTKQALQEALQQHFHVSAEASLLEAPSQGGLPWFKQWLKQTLQKPSAH